MKNVILICLMALMCGGLVMGCEEKDHAKRSGENVYRELLKKSDRKFSGAETTYVRCDVKGCNELAVSVLNKSGEKGYYCEIHGKVAGATRVMCSLPGCTHPAASIPVRTNIVYEDDYSITPGCAEHGDIISGGFGGLSPHSTKGR